MAVIVTEFLKETKLDTFGSYMFEVSNDETGYSKYFRITKDNYIFLSGLQQGTYEVSYIFVYDSGKRGSRDQLFTFFVNEGKARIVNKKIIVKLYKNSTKNYATMTRYTRDISLADQENIKKKLFEEMPELTAWSWQ